MKSLAVHLVLLFVLTCGTGCLGIGSPPKKNMTDDEIMALYKTLRIGNDANEWFTAHQVTPEFSLPILYPENPEAVLNRYGPKGIWPTGQCFQQHVSGYKLTPEEWRHSVLDWLGSGTERSKRDYPKDREKGIRLDYPDELYDTLPVDGTYYVHFIFLKKYVAYDSIFPRKLISYILIIVAPDGKIAGRLKINSYPPEAIARMKKIGIYLW